MLGVGVALAMACSASGDKVDGAGEHHVMIRVSDGAIGGPATQGDWDAATAEPNVECGVDDVRSDDIGDRQDHSVPDEGWDKPRTPSGDRCGDDYETLLFRMTNCEREVRGLPALDCDRRMVWAGREHSRDMERRDYFDHVTPEGLTPDDRLDERGVDWLATAENIAQAPTLALAHTAWMESRGHRTNVLSADVTHMGVGVIEGERGYMITTLFIDPP